MRSAATPFSKLYGVVRCIRVDSAQAQAALRKHWCWFPPQARTCEDVFSLSLPPAFVGDRAPQAPPGAGGQPEPVPDMFDSPEPVVRTIATCSLPRRGCEVVRRKPADPMPTAEHERPEGRASAGRQRAVAVAMSHAPAWRYRTARDGIGSGGNARRTRGETVSTCKELRVRSKPSKA